MGELRETLVDGKQEVIDLKLTRYQTVTAVGEKIYVIGESDDESDSTVGVRVFDSSAGKWRNPAILGVQPTICKAHSAVLVNNDGILIFKRDSTPDDCTWFLERCILDIDVRGARSVRANSLDAIFIFVCPPTFEELEKRLRARGTETEEQVQKHLRNARAELEEGKSSGLFDHILVKDNLDTCYESLKVHYPTVSRTYGSEASSIVCAPECAITPASVNGNELGRHYYPIAIKYWKNELSKKKKTANKQRKRKITIADQNDVKHSTYEATGGTTPYEW